MTPQARRNYASTPLPKKLGIREGSRILLVDAPPGFALDQIPPGARVLRHARGPLDVVVLFSTAERDLRERFDRVAALLDPSGRLWVAWPKKAAGIPTDLTFPVVQQIGLAAGLVDNKSASIDPSFQGLQFVYRLRDRPPR